MAKDTFIFGQSAFTLNWTFKYALINNLEISLVGCKAKMGLLTVSKKIWVKYEHNIGNVSDFQGLGILLNSKNKDAAWTYIKFITSQEFQKAHLK